MFQIKEINIGSIISFNRKQKGITQEELADFLGVSKPAVSKWESAQSYPDITLLPILATYFNISVDELLCYTPQMLKEDIKILYARLSKDFNKKTFDEVYAECMDYAKKYYSCWRLQLQIAILLLNHAPLSGSNEKTMDIIAEAQKIFERISNECSDISINRQAVCLQAYCYLAANQPIAAIDLLDGIEESLMSPDSLLSNAYRMKGDIPKAKSLIQSVIYKSLITFMGACPQLMLLYIDQPERAKDCLDKTLSLGEIFDIKKMHPSLYFQIYLTAAHIFITQGNKQEALAMLEEYAKISLDPKLFPLKLHGNEFFDSLDQFFDSLDLGTQLPRSDETVKQSIKDSVLKNPAFESLIEEPRYKLLAKKLEQN